LALRRRAPRREERGVQARGGEGDKSWWDPCLAFLVPTQNPKTLQPRNLRPCAVNPKRWTLTLAAQT
jgi:hypothetical protein